MRSTPLQSEFVQFIRLALIILAVIVLASAGLLFESINGLAWLLAVPIVVALFLWGRRFFSSTRFGDGVG